MSSVTTPPSWIDLNPDQRSAAIIDDLCQATSVSAGTQKLLDLTSRKDARMTPIVEEIAKTPHLAAEIIKVANSPIYSPGKDITNLRKAVVLLGLHEIHNLAACLSMMSMFNTNGTASSYLEQSAVLSATIARKLADKIVAMDAAEAFVTGMMSEIGAMAVSQADPDGFAEIWKTNKGTPRAQEKAEIDRYGTHANAIGAALLTHNHFPLRITETVALAFDDACHSESLLAKVTAFSKYATHLLIAAGTDNDAAPVKQGIPALAQELGFCGFSPQKLISLCLEAADKAIKALRGIEDLYDFPEDDSDTTEEGVDVDMDALSPLPSSSTQKTSLIGRLFGRTRR